MKRRYDLNNKTNKASVIDCLECENYYTGACDALAGGCNAYTPTRKITMADDIKTIKRRQNLMYATLIAMLCVLCAIGVAIL